MVVTLFATPLWAADAPAKEGEAKGESLTKIDQLTKLAYERRDSTANNYTSGGNTKSGNIVLPLSQGLNRLIPTRLGSQFS